MRGGVTPDMTTRINAKKGQKALIERKGIAVTRFGRQFIASVVVDHADLRDVMNNTDFHRDFSTNACR